MENPSKQVIDELLANTATPAITIYIPMHTTASPPHITENQIRFKNLLHKAAGQLKKSGAERKLAETLENLVKNHHDNLDFWGSQTPALLICASPDTLRMFHLPVDSEEYVAVDQRFHLAPLLGLIDDSREFYMLALAQQEPRLYKGDLYGLHESKIRLPATIAEALNLDENNQKSENQGTAAGPSTQGGNGSGGSWFNGRGGARSPQEEDRIRFFRLLDSVICSKAKTALPLILAGVESDIAEYRSLSKYPHVLGSTVAGNQSDTPQAKLFAAALNIIQLEIVEPEHQSAVEEYTRLRGANPGKVTQDEKDVLSAAEEGRVDKLLAPTYRTTADTVRDSFADVLQITFPEAGQAKALNKAAAIVWQMRGKVINLLPEQLPNNPAMAARLRY